MPLSRAKERERDSRNERESMDERGSRLSQSCQRSRAPVRQTQAQLALRWPVVSLSARAAWWSRHRGNWQLGTRTEPEQLSESTHLRTTQTLHYQLHISLSLFPCFYHCLQFFTFHFTVLMFSFIEKYRSAHKQITVRGLMVLLYSVLCCQNKVNKKL